MIKNKKIQDLKMVKAVIYTRVSSLKQKTNFSHEVQEKMARDFLESFRWKNKKIGVACVVREQASAFKIVCPKNHKRCLKKVFFGPQRELLRLLESRESGDFIIVSRADRLARDNTKLKYILELVEKKGLVLVVLRDNGIPLFSNNSEDIVLLEQLVTQANNESQNISSRIISTRRYLENLGKIMNLEFYLGGSIPYGKKVEQQVVSISGIDHTFKVLVDNLDEQEVINIVHNMNQRESKLRIARHLNSIQRTNRGIPWTSYTISKLVERTQKQNYNNVLNSLVNLSL